MDAVDRLAFCLPAARTVPQRARFAHDGEAHRTEQFGRNDGGDGAFERQRRQVRRHCARGGVEAMRRRVNKTNVENIECETGSFTMLFLEERFKKSPILDSKYSLVRVR
jgi:hypothetical protein